MTVKECTALLAPVALAFRAQIDAPTFRAYHRVLEDVPVVALQAAIEQLGKDGRTFFPSAPELRQMAENARLEMRAALKFEPCAMCSSDGWTETAVDGVRRMTRCSCWHRHQQRIQALGVGAEPLALPPSREFSQVGEIEP